MQELYGQVVGQLRRYTGHVTGNIGGIYEYDKTADEKGAVYTHVSKARQQAAVNFLNQEIFATPKWLIDKDILSKIEADGNVDRIRSFQARALGSLFNQDRLKRMIENGAVNQKEAYTMEQLFDDTRSSIFSEISKGASIDAYRRNLQRAYVDQMKSLLMISNDKYDHVRYQSNGQSHFRSHKAGYQQTRKQTNRSYVFLSP